MDTPASELVEVINRLGTCLKRQMHLTVAQTIDDAFNEAVDSQ
jgi:hypothetical protein